MKFSTEQINKILEQEKDEYLWDLIHKFKNDKRLKLPDEQIEDLFKRLKETYGYLMELGFSKKNLIEAFLYGEAVTPGYKDNPMIKNWVEKLGEIPENQYEDLLIIADKMQKGLL